MGLFENFPYTNFHELNLSWFLDTFRQLLTEWEEQKREFADLKDAWEEMRQWVTDYFDNLDVQEEINNKLDEMYQSGELGLILNQLFTPYNNRLSVLESRMNSYEALEPGSTTGDAELQDIRVGYAGAVYATAGDAVRDQVQELHDEIGFIGIDNTVTLTWQQKGINTLGYESASTTRISSASFIPSSGTPFTVVPGVGMKYSLRYYTDRNWQSITGYTDFYVGTHTFIIPEGQYYKLNVGYTDESAITTDAGADMSVSYKEYTDKTLTISGQPADAKVTGDRLNDLAEATSNLLIDTGEIVAKQVTTPSYSLRSPYVIRADGVVTAVPDGDARYQVTDYIPVQYGQYVAFQYGASRYNNQIYAFYDEDHRVVEHSHREGSGFLAYAMRRILVPFGAKYFALSYDVDPAVYPTGVKIITEWEPLEINASVMDIANIPESFFQLDDNVPTNTVLSGAVITGRGLLSTDQTSNYKVTEADVVAGNTYFIGNALHKFTNATYVFYDAADITVTSFVGEADHLYNRAVTIPEGVVKVRISGYGTAAYIKLATELTFTGGSWTGLKWAGMGDSITDSNNARATKRYFDYIHDYTGIQFTNLGVSGTGYKKDYNGNDPFYLRTDDIPLDSDVITIFGSGNDCSLTLGTPTDTGTSTVCGCINQTIDNIRARIVGANIGIISPTPWDNYPTYTDNAMSRYCEALEQICELKGVPFLNLYRCSNMLPWEASFRAAYYSHDDGNGVHPDENGHKFFAPHILAFLKTLLLI